MQTLHKLEDVSEALDWIEDDPYRPIRADDGTCTVCRRYTDEAYHGACLIKAGAL